jgi:lysophospholipase L1-like esterase
MIGGLARWQSFWALALVSAVFAAGAIDFGGGSALVRASRAVGSRLSWSERSRDAGQFDLVQPRTDIVFVGDSLTEGGLWQDVLRDRVVTCRARGGQTVSEIGQWADAVVALRPRQVFVMAGINDLQRGVPIDEVLGSYVRLVEAFREGGASVVVQSTLECERRFGAGLLAAVRELNVRLSERMQRRDGVSWLDINSSLAGGEQGLREAFSTDGVHLNPSGYQRWYELVCPLALPAVPR